MKKFFAVLLTLCLMLALCACDSGENTPETTAVADASIGTEAIETTAAPEQTEAPVVQEEGFCLTFNGVELIPGTVYDAAALPEPGSVYQVPSCAIEGTDNLYNYGTFELTAFDDGEKELIYSILLTDPNITTTEGLALGDDVQKMVDLYGEGYTQQGNAYVYTGDAELLYIITQNDKVASIEYRMIT